MQFTGATATKNKMETRKR